MLYSYDNQNIAAHGKDAAIADASPLNLLTSEACFVKSFLASDAWSLVLIESIGNSARSIERPAIPPDATAIANV